ncbi:hypothetical protein HELRODRAFT_135898, partial [Helobdella robusta]|uniref:G-protein coupled receptors family 2 profile 2 domain-containing protein n=1 Tax=Helobdella robusta TaxID=6412 RepID=T1EIB0_HELRO
LSGLYLHTLLFVNVFSESRHVKWFIIFGWTFPLLIVVPWMLSMMADTNIKCWFYNDNYWIIKIPWLVTVLLNFFFFVKILRFLSSKLQTSNLMEARKYRRVLTRSTLVLIPLFGIPYLMFAWIPDGKNVSLDVAALYYDMAFTSFNGLFVSLLYCFFNREV